MYRVPCAAVPPSTYFAYGTLTLTTPTFCSGPVRETVPRIDLFNSPLPRRFGHRFDGACRRGGAFAFDAALVSAVTFTIQRRTTPSESNRVPGWSSMTVKTAFAIRSSRPSTCRRRPRPPVPVGCSCRRCSPCRTDRGSTRRRGTWSPCPQLQRGRLPHVRRWRPLAVDQLQVGTAHDPQLDVDPGLGGAVPDPGVLGADLVRLVAGDQPNPRHPGAGAAAVEVVPGGCFTGDDLAETDRRQTVRDDLGAQAVAEQNQPIERRGGLY